MGQLITASICLTDIPKEKIQVSEKNGKKYLSICISELQNISQFGDTHTIYVSQTATERQTGQPKTYLGHGKNLVPKQTTAQGQVNPFSDPNRVQAAKQSAQDDDDLPF